MKNRKPVIYFKDKLVAELQDALEDLWFWDESFKSTNDQWDVYMSEYWPICDTLVSQVSEHWIILCDTWWEYYLSYQVSDVIDWKWITLVIDNSWESTEIKSLEDLAEEIIRCQHLFEVYLEAIYNNYK